LGLGPEDELGGVMAQWMEWNLDGHWRAADGTDYAGRLAEIRVPVMGLAGAGDRIESPPDASRALIQLMGSSDRTFEV
ncbi:MAG: esterase, partial [Gammaproteobacteria bacterium]|nr:alpha/beta hydrolase [Gemmatimonadota bacterium]NIU79339.1 esterase [Gammaproteobacteria bacterium]